MSNSNTTSPRRVGISEADAFEVATGKLSAAMDRLSNQVQRARGEVLSLAGAGHEGLAMSVGNEAMASASIQYSAACAEFELAVIAFLGERCSPLETFENYQQRISAAMVSITDMVNMQQKNGIQLCFC
ncbi:MAG: hypothetical protein EPO09_13575 [Aquabacterium sp.]|uniref:hypothetical protein n=1 Tax=Aquabacterium sp. TaxID=1872578 RepID=UPI00121DBAFB|nr:hypothetical protein [Aquabacterium sp.]TAK93142.1 MAG: hypothetical protein EPO09_13575 [Aquabacterium sp.]